MHKHKEALVCHYKELNLIICRRINGIGDNFVEQNMSDAFWGSTDVVNISTVPTQLHSTLSSQKKPLLRHPQKKNQKKKRTITHNAVNLSTKIALESTRVLNHLPVSNMFNSGHFFSLMECSVLGDGIQLLGLLLPRCPPSL